MHLLDLSPRIFRDFPEIRSFFAIGQSNFVSSSPGAVHSEKKKILEAIKAYESGLVFLSQIHSNQVSPILDPAEIDKFSHDLPEADGSFTNLPDLYLGVRTADCLLILFYNPTARLAGALHAGWRGTRLEIIKEALREVQKKFPVSLQDFSFFLGPAAQVCCYEISKDLEKEEKPAKFSPREFVQRSDGRIYLDFVGANVRQLKEMGIRDDQIENSGICTIHDQAYPSHRREKDSRREVLLSLIGIYDSRRIEK